MGRYVTRRGIVVEVGDEAARAVGYLPEKDAPAKSAAKAAKQDDKPAEKK